MSIALFHGGVRFTKLAVFTLAWNATFLIFTLHILVSHSVIFYLLLSHKRFDFFGFFFSVIRSVIRFVIRSVIRYVIRFDSGFVDAGYILNL